MSSERYTPEAWQQQCNPAPDWEETFRVGQWSSLGELSQSARYAVIAGYVHRLIEGGHVLDAGCGEGVLINYLDRSRLEYTGFDISLTAVCRAKEHYPSARLFRCSIEDFVPPEGVYYDIIIFNESLATLKRPIEMIDQFYSFLRPGGHIIVSQFQPENQNDNGALLTRMFEAELAAGRYRIVVRSEVLNPDTGRKWRCYCLN